MNRLIQFSHFILSLLLILSISGCKNDIEESPPITDYFPVINGMTWSTPLGSSTLTVMSTDSNGNVYFQLTNGTYFDFILTQNEVRWTFDGGLGSNFLFFDAPDFPEVLLSRPLVKGHRWYSENNATVKSEIIETNTIVYNATLVAYFNNVLVVRETYTYPSGWVYGGTELKYRDLYYAKGYGLIRSEGMLYDFSIYGPYEITAFP